MGHVADPLSSKFADESVANRQIGEVKQLANSVIVCEHSNLIRTNVGMLCTVID